MTTANRLASGAGLDEIGPEHVVLALFSEPKGVAAKVLVDLGVTEPALADALAHTAPPGDCSGSIAFATDTMTVLENALQEALRLGHNFIGTEHLLLGVLAAPGLDATRVLAGLGVTTESVEPKVVEMLTGIVAGRR